MRVSFRRNNDLLIDENHDHREMKQSVASLNIIAAASKPPALCVLRGNCLFEDTFCLQREDYFYIRERRTGEYTYISVDLMCAQYTLYV
jgi:hypothetical protein